MAKKQSPFLFTEQATSGQTPVAQPPSSRSTARTARKNQTPPPYEEDITAKAETTPAKEFPTEEWLLAQRPPPDVAILHVHAHDEDKFALWGGHMKWQLPPTAPQSKPNLALGEMVQDRNLPGVELPHIIQEFMGEFSHTNFELRGWLKQLHRIYGNNLKIIIMDHTDFEIPWEMLELSLNEYLGATITTTRWQQVITENGRRLLNLEPDECVGHAIAYVNEAELKGIGPELELLNTLNAAQYKDTTLFRKRLEQNEAGVGLIYMAGHGIFDPHVRKMALGALEDDSQRLRLMSLYRCRLHLFAHSQAIVFINACHSGRLRKDDRLVRDDYRRGFAELFLRKGARGVIATLGGVNDAYAARVAHKLIHAARQSPHLPIAALLREQRAQVVAKLPDDPSDEELLDFIYTFMYVYYGSPQTRLRLVKREE